MKRCITGNIVEYSSVFKLHLYKRQGDRHIGKDVS